MAPRPRPCKDPEIAASAPDVPYLTDYDYRLLVTYLRLLDAETEGADWHEVVRIVLKADPDRDYLRAKNCYDSHLTRAHWMTEQGYRHLLQEADDEW